MVAAKPKVLNQRDAIRLLRKVVKGRKDYVYEKVVRPGGHYATCLYRANDGQPSCIVGHVLDLWEPGIEIPEGATPEAPGFLPGRISDEARQVLSSAQDIQDQGGTWGEALEAAELTYGGGRVWWVA